MKTKTLRHKSYSHFLCALAVFDTLSLIIRQIESVDEYYVSHAAKPGVFQHFNNFSCKLYNYLAHAVTLMSSWLVVFMAIERLIAVCFPFKNAAFRKQPGALKAIGLLVIVVLVSQSFRFVMIEHLVYDPEYGIWDCLAGDSFVQLYTSLDVYFFQWSLVFVLPVMLIIICNCMVIYQILKVRRALYRNGRYFTYTEDGVAEKSPTHRDNRAMGKKHRSTYMLLTVTFTYILTLLPLFTLSLIVDLTIKLRDMETARYMFLTLRPYIDMCVSISLLNYAVNFFIYVLSGKRFRYELQRSLRRGNFNKPKRSFTARSTREELLRNL